MQSWFNPATREITVENDEGKKLTLSETQVQAYQQFQQ